MEVGILTAPFGREDLDVVINFAKESGFDALEVAAGPGSKHIDPAKLTKSEAKTILGKLDGLKISSLAYYANVVDADPKGREAVLSHLRKAVDAASMLGVDVVCAMAGFPLPGKSKMKTIEEDVPGALGPVVEYAGSKGIKIALENWYATNIQNLEHWERIFEVIPAKNFGLNYDPSHLYWQQIDYLWAVEHFAERIFHTHAKDTAIKTHLLKKAGVIGDGWWRYCIPGYGGINWGEYIAVLRDNGYNGVLSIEHEDRAFGREEGFLKGLRHLRLFA